MRLLKLNILLTLGFIRIFTSSFAQESTRLELGFYLGTAENLHSVNFVSVTGFENYGPPFQSTGNLVFTPNINMEYYPFKEVSIDLYAGYLPLGIDLTTREFIGNQVINGNLVHVFSNHSFQPTFSMVKLAPCINYYLNKRNGLFISAGASFGLLLNKKATQTEFLDDNIYKNGIEYYDGSNPLGQSRNVKNGILYTNSTMFGLSAGLGYKYEFSNKINVSLKADYIAWLMDVMPKTNWRISNLQLGLTIAYTIFGTAMNTEPEQISVQKNDQFNSKSSSQNEITIGNNVNNSIEQKIPEKKEECCYIIFSTSDDEQAIKRLYAKFILYKMNDIAIRTFFDTKDNVTYFRLCSLCFPDAHSAIDYLKNLKLYNDIAKLLTNYYIKCDD